MEWFNTPEVRRKVRWETSISHCSQRSLSGIVLVGWGEVRQEEEKQSAVTDTHLTDLLLNTIVLSAMHKEHADLSLLPSVPGSVHGGKNSECSAHASRKGCKYYHEQ